jgi:hypothetical protein
LPTRSGNWPNFQCGSDRRDNSALIHTITTPAPQTAIPAPRQNPHRPGAKIGRTSVPSLSCFTLSASGGSREAGESVTIHRAPLPGTEIGKCTASDILIVTVPCREKSIYVRQRADRTRKLVQGLCSGVDHQAGVVGIAVIRTRGTPCLMTDAPRCGASRTPRTICRPVDAALAAPAPDLAIQIHPDGRQTMRRLIPRSGRPEFDGRAPRRVMITGDALCCPAIDPVPPAAAPNNRRRL